MKQIGIDQKKFATVLDGKKIELFNLKNSEGTLAQITNYGGKIVSLYTKDRNGDFADIVLGFETGEEYVNGNAYFGALCGRFANRIANGKFTIGGKEYKLAVNNGPNALHGGLLGIWGKVWDVVESTSNSLKIAYTSPDMEEGYPGNLEILVTYTMTEDNELVIDYEARTDKATVLNLTSHSFFNLAGEGNGDILDHVLKINAETMTPVDETQIPTGQFTSVAGTPFDFRAEKAIGKDIDAKDKQIEIGVGYDHNFVIDKPLGKVGFAAEITDPKSGRSMQVLTDTPGMQLYTGNWLDGSDKGKGHVYGKREAVCLETQNYPDAPNKPEFPTALLKPGEVYTQKCIHKFSIK